MKKLLRYFTTRKRPIVVTLGLFVLAVILLLFARIRSVGPTEPQFLSSPPPVPTVAPRVEKLTVITGIAQLEGPNGNQTVSEGNSITLEPPAIINTRPSTLITLDYGQGTLVRVGANSKIVFDEKTPTQGFLTHTLGSLYVRFEKILGKRESFTVETPTVIATVRGTKYASFVDKNKVTKIVAIEDTIKVTVRDALTGNPKPETTTNLAPGNQVMGDPNKALVVGKTTLTTDEAAWLTLNEQADAVGDSTSSLFELAVKLFATPTPTTTPMPTPLSSGTPTPTKPMFQTITSMPGEGYSRSSVVTDAGTFTLSCMGSNKNSTKVITDSGNDTDCKDNCTVMPLHEYATRNGGFAAVNGMYFCPSDYDWCAGKVNSFDTLFFNSRAKRYINSDNNVFSTIPFLAVESNGNPLFKRHSSDWGRDTGIQAGSAGNPLMIADGRNVMGDYSLDTKMQTVKAARAAYVQEGEIVYLCVVANATVPDATKVYEVLGADNAINFDSGGSTAFWVNGNYIYGPGRNIPTAIIFTR